MNGKLVEVLKKYGFVDVSGTVDLGGCTFLGRREEDDILGLGSEEERRWSGHFDTNNGTGVVWDFEGKPWVCRGYDKLTSVVKEAGVELRRGAFVPHSNDGGHFICALFPEKGLSVPGNWCVVVREASLVVTSPTSMQLLQAAKDLRENKTCTEQDDIVAGQLIELAAKVEDRVLLPREAMALAIAEAKKLL